MGRYTYTLNQKREEPSMNFYRRADLEKMTTFHLREICRKERLVVPAAQSGDRESLIRLLMRFRGQKEYRRIQTGCEEGLEHIQEYLRGHDVLLTDRLSVRIPGTITLYQGTQMNELDGYQVQSDGELHEGNLLLVDETGLVYTCFYIQKIRGKFFLFKGRTCRSGNWKSISILFCIRSGRGIRNSYMTAIMGTAPQFRERWKRSGSRFWIFRKRKS